MSVNVAIRSDLFAEHIPSLPVPNSRSPALEFDVNIPRLEQWILPMPRPLHGYSTWIHSLTSHRYAERAYMSGLRSSSTIDKVCFGARMGLVLSLYPLDRPKIIGNDHVIAERLIFDLV